MENAFVSHKDGSVYEIRGKFGTKNGWKGLQNVSFHSFNGNKDLLPEVKPFELEQPKGFS